MRPIHNTSDKVNRHRARMRASGLRPVQFWVPDTRSVEFAELIRHQCLALTNDPAEKETIDFGDDAASQIEGWE